LRSNSELKGENRIFFDQFEPASNFKYLVSLLLASQGCWALNSLNNPKPPAPGHPLLLRNSPCLLLDRFAITLRVSVSGGAQQLGLWPQTIFACFRLKPAMLGCAEGEMVRIMNRSRSVLFSWKSPSNGEK